MLKRLIRWLKRLFQSLFGKKQAPVKFKGDVCKVTPPPPLTDTDLEFLFTELLEGVHQARGQHWVQKWLHNIEDRVSTERWVEWLRGFGERLLASPTPNNELASRLVQLGELEVGEIGDVAYEIGMQLLVRNQQEPVWDYEGPDLEPIDFLNLQNESLQAQTKSFQDSQQVNETENLPETEFQTVTLDELLVLMQQDENLRQMIAQQLGIETNDPQAIVQALINQFQTANQSNSDTDQD
jgi:hypothetical protein